jgi:hypothetical protein
MSATRRPDQIQLSSGLAGTHREGRRRGGEDQGGLWLRLQVAWRSAALDRELAEGVDSGSSPLLALRARTLTAPRGRRRIADGLVRAQRSARSRTPGITAAIQPDARELRAASPVLAALGERLHDAEPVAAQGVAMLALLLTDGESVLYRPGVRRGPGSPSDPSDPARHRDLVSCLRAAAAALQP